MKINFNHKIEVNGQTIKDEVGKDVSVGVLCCKALDFLPESEKDLAGSERSKRGNLALKLFKSVEEDVSIEEVALIKEQIGKVYTPLVVASLYNFLEGSNG